MAGLLRCFLRLPSDSANYEILAPLLEMMLCFPKLNVTNNPCYCDTMAVYFFSVEGTLSLCQHRIFDSALKSMFSCDSNAPHVKANALCDSIRFMCYHCTFSVFFAIHKFRKRFPKQNLYTVNRSLLARTSRPLIFSPCSPRYNDSCIPHIGE